MKARLLLLSFGLLFACKPDCMGKRELPDADNSTATPNTSTFKKDLSSNTNNDTINEVSKMQQWRKDWAFCRCLNHALGKSVANQISKVDITEGVLFDIANIGPVYEQLDSLALDASRKMIPSKLEDHDYNKSIIFDCLKFQRSKELDIFIKSLK
ncbi:hypothetical protein [Rufibacter soli]